MLIFWDVSHGEARFDVFGAEQLGDGQDSVHTACHGASTVSDITVVLLSLVLLMGLPSTVMVMVIAHCQYYTVSFTVNSHCQWLLFNGICPL